MVVCLRSSHRTWCQNMNCATVACTERARQCRSKTRSAANATVTAASSSTQEVEFTSIVNLPMKLAVSDESGKDSVSFLMLWDSNVAIKQDVERSTKSKFTFPTETFPLVRKLVVEVS